MEVVFTFIDYDLTLCTFFRYCGGKNIYRIKKELFLIFETDVGELWEEWKMSSWEGSSGVAR